MTTLPSTLPSESDAQVVPFSALREATELYGNSARGRNMRGTLRAGQVLYYAALALLAAHELSGAGPS